MFGLEAVPVELKVAKLKMLRFSLGVAKCNMIRNQYIQGTTRVRKLGEKGEK